MYTAVAKFSLIHHKIGQKFINTNNHEQHKQIISQQCNITLPLEAEHPELLDQIAVSTGVPCKRKL